MKMKNYWDKEKKVSRRLLYNLCWLCSIPFVGWIALILIGLIKPDGKVGNKWE